MLSNIILASLFYIKYQPFEIFALWMKDIDGVIGRLMQLV